jgi:glycosyltransferase involved in cell wall biosynthesis
MNNTSSPLGKEDALGPQNFRILVVIPTLGERLETLARTLKSISEQSDVFVDTIVVAKTKTDALCTLAENFRATLVFHPGNISAAINAGFAQASFDHKYVSWIGDDDMLRPNALSTASGLLERHPTAVATYGSCDYIDLSGNVLFNRRPPPMASFLLQFVPGLIKQETCLFKRSAVDSTGGLNVKLKYTMDLDVLLKLRHLGPFVKSDQVMAAFCWHPGSITVSNRRASLDEAQEVQRSHAKGIVRMLYPLWKFPIRYLILGASWKINRNLSKQIGPSGPNGRN